MKTNNKNRQVRKSSAVNNYNADIYKEIASLYNDNETLENGFNLARALFGRNALRVSEQSSEDRTKYHYIYMQMKRSLSFGEAVYLYESKMRVNTSVIKGIIESRSSAVASRPKYGADIDAMNRKNLSALPISRMIDYFDKVDANHGYDAADIQAMSFEDIIEILNRLVINRYESIANEYLNGLINNI